MTPPINSNGPRGGHTTRTSDGVVSVAPGADAVPALLLIDRRDIAAMCSVSVVTIDRWAASGKLPRSIKLSAKCVRWTAESIRRWVSLGCPNRKEFEAMVGDSHHAR